MTRAGFRLAAPIALATAIAAGSCTDINSASDHIAALEFTRLPYPSVVSGDTLRDSLGVAAPLRALAFNSGGREVEGAEVQYLALDTGITISSSGMVRATRRSGQVPIVASTAVLQSKAVNLLITRRPDSAFVTLGARDTIKYDILAPASTANNSKELTVRVITGDSTGGITNTQGWLVSYQAVFRGSVMAPGDTSKVFLLGDGIQRSVIDTTSSGGIGSRRLRLNLINVSPTDADSAVVTATVRYKGQQVRGSPLRFVILFRAK